MNDKLPPLSQRLAILVIGIVGIFLHTGWMGHSLWACMQGLVAGVCMGTFFIFMHSYVNVKIVEYAQSKGYMTREQAKAILDHQK